MKTYDGLSLAATMNKGDKATCIVGTYRNYEVHMNEWGDLCWENNSIVGLDRWFINSEWTMKKA